MSFKLPGKILEEYTVRNNRLGLVQFGGTCRPIFLDLVPEAHIGDYVRVHVGFAVEQVPAVEALQAYDELRQSGGLNSTEADLITEDALPAMARRQKDVLRRPS
jgi:hydrogenase expression/formation protein HypC